MMWRGNSLATRANQIAWLSHRRWFTAKVANGESSWRKEQLEKLESRFLAKEATAAKNTSIKDDNELQTHWKEMEGRVVRRKPLSREQAAGKVGRRNIRKTDEDVWMQSGLYDRKES